MINVLYMYEITRLINWMNLCRYVTERSLNIQVTKRRRNDMKQNIPHVYRQSMKPVLALVPPCFSFFRRLGYECSVVRIFLCWQICLWYRSESKCCVSCVSWLFCLFCVWIVPTAQLPRNVHHQPPWTQPPHSTYHLPLRLRLSVLVSQVYLIHWELLLRSSYVQLCLLQSRYNRLQSKTGLRSSGPALLLFRSSTTLSQARLNKDCWKMDISTVIIEAEASQRLVRVQRANSR